MFSIIIALAAAATQTAPADLPAWVAEVNRRIDKHIIQPTNDEAGTATVTFRRGADGRPVDITAKSGSFAISRAAVRTVKAIGVLPAWPGSVASNQRVVLNFLVGRLGYEGDYFTARTAMLAAAKKSNVDLAARLSQIQVAAASANGPQIASLSGR